RVTRYVVRRCQLALLVIWVLSILVFVALRLTPGDPAVVRAGLGASPEQVARERAALGLDDPLPVQYLRWAGAVTRFDLGRSSASGEGVAAGLASRVPVTVELVGLAALWMMLLGVPLGVVGALRRNRAVDHAIRIVAVVALAVPSFWLATLTLMLPQQAVGYAPPLDGARSLFEEPWANLRQFVPASLVLALASLATVSRVTRASLVEVMASDFVRTARAKGLGERALVMRHALPGALIPVLTLVGLQVGGLLGGAIIVESIFNLDGVGDYFFRAVLEKDFEVAQGVALYLAVSVVVLNLAVDLAYAWLDPRIRYASDD
ncbi:MAG: ABC transporter permease, partial [Dehalococcoidia bacterium]